MVAQLLDQIILVDNREGVAAINLYFSYSIELRLVEEILHQLIGSLIPGGAGFLPSTVITTNCSKDFHDCFNRRVCCEKPSFKLFWVANLCTPWTRVNLEKTDCPYPLKMLEPLPWLTISCHLGKDQTKGGEHT